MIFDLQVDADSTYRSLSNLSANRRAKRQYDGYGSAPVQAAGEDW